MDINEHDLIDLTKSIWETLVGLDLSPLDGARVPDDPRTLLTAYVHITGAWRRTVTVECVDCLARRIAESMFRMPPSEITDSETIDSLGEIANVIAGNVKAVASTHCDLSLPTVVRGDRFTALAPASELRSQTTFTCDGQLICVSVLETTETAEDPPIARV